MQKKLKELKGDATKISKECKTRFDKNVKEIAKKPKTVEKVVEKQVEKEEVEEEVLSEQPVEEKEPSEAPEEVSTPPKIESPPISPYLSKAASIESIEPTPIITPIESVVESVPAAPAFTEKDKAKLKDDIMKDVMD